MATQPITRLTEEEYLELERAAVEKSEFVDGEMFLMPGGSLRHARLATRCGTVLDTRLGNKGMLVFSNLRARTPKTGSFVYPDVAIVAGKPETYKASRDNLTNPTVVVEVLSPSTADYDHGKKFSLYREIPTFAEYVLVHTDSAFVEHYARQEDGSWVLRDHRGLESELTIPSLNCKIQLAEIYAGVFDIPE